MTCPICQKAGINAAALICPQCNSDLSQFHLLTRMENKFANWRKRNSILLIIFSILIIALIVILLYPNMDNTPITNSQKSLNENIDSTEYYRNKYFAVSNKIDSLDKIVEPKSFINYKVKSGDNLSKIALMFYDDVGMTNKIAKDNGLKNANRLFVNQSLIIEIDK
jgi:hypothetical protein